ncbi:MAG: FAD-dependent monooxygenase, partial [Gemmatimonadales bacterium]
MRGPPGGYDVVVVGAGLAGLVCAGRLAHQGIRVLLLDRKAAVGRPVHTTGIFVRRTLEDFALPAGCLGPPVRQVRLYSPAGRSLMLESARDEFRVGRMKELYDALLSEALAAGARWLPGTAYLRARAEGTGSRLHLRRETREFEVSTRFLVGADGAHSRVARDLGLGRNREWIVGVEQVHRGASMAGLPCFHCWIDPRIAPGYLAWVVQDGEEVHLGVGGYPSRFDPGRALRLFASRMATRLGFLAAGPVERRGGVIPVNGVLRRLASPRGLLIGDAAGAVSPLTAGGLDPCLRLTAHAVEVIEAGLGGRPQAVASYDGAAYRRRFALRRAARFLYRGLGSPRLVEAA